MTEPSAEDVTVRTHLLAGGESARGAVFIGRLGAFRFEAARDPHMGWTITLSSETEIPPRLREHLIATALTSIGLADALYRQPPPRILSVRLEDLNDEAAEFTVQVRDILTDVGIAQGFVSLPGKGRFTFQADRRPEGDWEITFGLDFYLPHKVVSRLEQAVLEEIERTGC